MRFTCRLGFTNARCDSSCKAKLPLFCLLRSSSPVLDGDSEFLSDSQIIANVLRMPLPIPVCIPVYISMTIRMFFDYMILGQDESITWSA